jgi:hypothetical protein
MRHRATCSFGTAPAVQDTIRHCPRKVTTFHFKLCCSTGHTCDPSTHCRMRHTSHDHTPARRHTRRTSRRRCSKSRGNTHTHSYQRGIHPHHRLGRQPAVSPALLTVSSVLFSRSDCSSILPLAWRLATDPVEISTFS